MRVVCTYGGDGGLTRYLVLSTEFKKLSVSPESFALTKELHSKSALKLFTVANLQY